ncbi:hypothetical protein AXG93_267s1170 [Marchantia polymorpha subsp. ruderalis]|uniref:Uncharacterized protein n=1 Tax=Marchantia polymorpha subsp. ruderalis TaxID=1480154 RepID=A0A176VM36_MARPO|nr:hypothetical protein AXG93_267s1170 [Marchantia polymorpha subsp. ruderalis]
MWSWRVVTLDSSVLSVDMYTTLKATQVEEGSRSAAMNPKSSPECAHDGHHRHRWDGIALHRSLLLGHRKSMDGIRLLPPDMSRTGSPSRSSFLPSVPEGKMAGSLMYHSRDQRGSIGGELSAGVWAKGEMNNQASSFSLLPEKRRERCEGRSGVEERGQDLSTCRPFEPDLLSERLHS